MKRWLLLALLLVMAVLRADAATTLLPNGMQCFQTAVGPVSSGSVAMYAPGTTTFKTTWQDPFQNAQNNAPIQLDANGCAIIYGVGSYRQQLWTGPVVGGRVSGNMIFDLLTADTSAGNSWFWAGTATGTINAIVLNDVGFTPTAGQNIQFQPSGQNSGPATITPYPGASPIPVVVDSAAGPASLVGNELAANNVANVVYDATANTFHLQNPLPSAAAVAVPVGGEISCAGFAAPTNFQFESGQSLLRTSFPLLWPQLSSTNTASLTSGQPKVTLTSGSTEQYAIGMAVETTGTSGGAMATTTIASIIDSSNFNVVANASGTGGANVTVWAYGIADPTHFNLPDRRGQILYGRNNMGGTAQTGLQSLNIASTTNTPNALGQNLRSGSALAGGSIQVSAAQLPTLSISASETAPGHHHSVASGAGGAAFVYSPGTGGSGIGGGVGSGSAATTDNTAASVTGSTTTTSNLGFSIVSPGQTTNWCIRVQ